MDSELSFEAAFAELEATVHQLETGNLPLADALALYERGIQLARLCASQLDTAELRVQQLMVVADDADDADIDEVDNESDDEEEPF
ncbi:MAG: exodeoxyribonuclease VII small subunit [Anaerolineae bacterium]|nr:exodeoxyribonuclease VII small subunit [Anaerolineae bacterium]